MRDAFILCLLAGAILIALRYPFVGILGWHWIAFLSPHRLTYGFAFDFQIAMAIGVAAILAFVFSNEPKKFPNSALFAITATLLVWVGITTLFAHDIDWSLEKWESVTKIVFMALLTSMLLTTRERIHALVWVTVIALGYYGFKGGLFTILTGGEHHVWGPPGTFIADNNQLALALITITPLTYYLSQSTPNIWLKRSLLAAIILLVFSAIGSQSRGALLGVLSMGAFFVLRTRYKAPVILGTILLIVVGIWFVPESWVERMSTIRDYETDESAMGRIEMWTFAVRLALDNPITGGGFHVGAISELFYSYIPDGNIPRAFHSIWFEMLGAHGFVGLAIYIVMLYLMWSNCRIVRRKTRDVPGMLWAFDLASMTQVAMVGYMSAGTFVSLAFFDLIYTIIAIIIGLRLVVERELAGVEKPVSRQERSIRRAASHARVRTRRPALPSSEAK